MSPPRKSGNDFEERYFNSLHDRLDKLEGTLDKILEQARKTNGNVIKHDEAIKALNNKVFRSLSPWYFDSKLVYFAAASLLVFLLIAAKTLGVNLPYVPL